jgi:UDP-GlcNAc:undecaprenyl-phosphate/decaprenyl-phosphate GlcNAc-1-phosphate transferase
MEVSTILIVCLVFFVSIAVFSFLLNGLLLKFSKTLGIRNNDETIIRWSPASKPALGGISFFICFLISVAGYAVFFSENTPLYNDKKLLGMLASSGIAFLMGLSDDAYNTKPLFKLLTQIICGIILILSGIYISFFEHNILNYFLTVVWVVGMMNSINMLDNMDAITAVVSSFVILAAIALYFVHGNFSILHMIMLVGVLASISGFLFYNWHPSKIFMGDTGSQFLGIFLASVGIMFFWNAGMPGGG